MVCLRLFGYSAALNRLEHPARAELTLGIGRVGPDTAAPGVTGQYLDTGQADVLWSPCDCSDRWWTMRFGADHCWPRCTPAAPVSPKSVTPTLPAARREVPREAQFGDVPDLPQGAAHLGVVGIR